MFKNRLYELDVLRGLSALSIVLFHYISLYSHVKTPYFLDFKYGFYGVHLFFMISGFVIYMTLTKCKNAKDFIYRRIIRLYPAYIFAVVFTYSIVKFFGLKGMEIPFTHGLFNLTMFQGFIPRITNVDEAYWTLKVELTFYIFMVCLMVLNLTKRIESVCITWLSTSAIIKILSIIFVDKYPRIMLLVDYGIVKYCHYFIAGIMFYHLMERPKPRHHLIIALCLLYQFAFNNMVSNILVSCFFGLFYLVSYGKLVSLNFKPFIFLGTISFSLYLTHQKAGYIIINYLEKNGLVNEIYIVIPVLISIGIATFITFCIEKPIQRFAKNALRFTQPRAINLEQKVAS